MKIITSRITPPIPIRSFDWCAYIDGMEDHSCGYGVTEQEAIKDLQIQLETHEPRNENQAPTGY